MSSFGVGSWVTKKSFDENWAGISTTITDAKAQVEAMKTQVNNAVASVNTATQNIQTTINTSVNNAISSATGGINNQIASVSSEVSSLRSQLNDINNQLNSLQVQVADTTEIDALSEEIVDMQESLNSLITRIKALEEDVIVVPESDPITFTVNTLGNLPVQMVVSANTSAQICTGSWQMLVTNNTDSTIKNIVLGVGIAGYGYSGLNYTSYITPSTTPQLVSNGGSVVWSLYQTNAQGLYFVSGWGYGVSQLSIPANSSLTLWVTLQVSITTPVGTALNTQLILQPFVQSYN
jgi:archaellum component FlaC